MSTFDAIGIVSERPSEALRFYRLLGVEFAKMGDHDHYEARTPSGIRLMLDSVDLIRSFEPGYTKPERSSITLCFKQASAVDVDALFERITSAGFRAQKAPWDAFWGQRYACVIDPDGNQIDLFAAL